jgi:transcriptional regulator with XRE-family HTH domain
MFAELTFWCPRSNMTVRKPGMIKREKINKLFGELLARRRKQARMTQRKFAKALGLSRTSVTNIERGRQPVSLPTLYLIAGILRRDVADLLPPIPGGSLNSSAPREQLTGLSSEERRALAKLSSKETEWLTGITSGKPARVG